MTDRQGREIYLTQERWEHILSKHPELSGRLEEVLVTIRMGRRKQSKLDPQTYCYYRRVTNLPEPYDTIMIFVAFRYRTRQLVLHLLQAPPLNLILQLYSFKPTPRARAIPVASLAQSIPVAA